MLRRLRSIAENNYDSTSYPKETERLLLGGYIVRGERSAPYTGAYRPPYSSPIKMPFLEATEEGRRALTDEPAEPCMSAGAATNKKGTDR